MPLSTSIQAIGVLNITRTLKTLRLVKHLKITLQAMQLILDVKLDLKEVKFSRDYIGLDLQELA